MESPEQLELLRRFEPVLRFNAGEMFFPTSVADFVADAALYVDSGGRKPRMVVDHGGLTLAALSEAGREYAGRQLFLRRVTEPLDRSEYRKWRRSPDLPAFRSSSRFAAVGLLSRLVDAVIRLTLLLRGRVPGGYAAAAQIAYARSPGSQAYTYYGHVSRDAGYIVLQYWYFYAMNDWRSSFGGVNDHESDWEQVTIFLTDTDDPLPVWVAFSSHDEVGDDLRRRWDDPDIEFVDETHPVVYAGAGSHSGAYLRGEYLIAAAVPLPAWIDRARRAFLRVIPWHEDDASGAIGIPYIDYRRGDGLTVGPGGERPWQAELIEDTTDWVFDYRGLWGLDTEDPLGGERAPAGPRYNRDETVRESWGQPVAWAGLDKEEPTDDQARRRLEWARDQVVAQLADADARLAIAREGLRATRAADRAMGHPPTKPGLRQLEMAGEVAVIRAEQADLRRQVEGIDRGVGAPLPVEPVHAHLRHRAEPLSAADTARGRVLRVWSAASASVLLAALGVVLLLQDNSILPLILGIAAAMLVIEAILRGRLLGLLVGVAVIALAVVAIWAIVSIIFGNLRLGFGIALLLAALYMAVQTAREGLATR